KRRRHSHVATPRHADVLLPRHAANFQRGEEKSRTFFASDCGFKCKLSEINELEFGSARSPIVSMYDDVDRSLPKPSMRSELFEKSKCYRMKQNRRLNMIASIAIAARSTPSTGSDKSCG